MNTPLRRGFTLVELLIVIAIIGTLVGLLLPAINSARESARQADCLNNLKNLGAATVSYTTQKNGAFPGYMQVQKLSPTLPDQYTGGSNATSASDLGISWAAKLLPQLDMQGLWDQMLSTPGFNYANPPRQSIFVCPSDVGTNVQLARLSYVANTGYFDRDPDEVINPNSGYDSDTKANGLFHDLRPGRKGPTVRQIKDGANTTMLISENIHKDEEAFGLSSSGGAGGGSLPNTWLGPIFPPNGTNANYEQTFGMVWVYASSSPNNPAEAGLQAPINRDPVSPQSYAGYNPPQSYARPASEHNAVFNVVFAGGNGKAVSQDIEYRVYQQLMTPDGAKADALDYTGNDEKQIMLQFMTPPLAESDY